MASKKLVVVFGATGSMGSSVMNSLLQEPNMWRVRGVCRNLNSVIARSFIGRGAEMVSADLGEPKTIINVLDGAYAVFALTIPETTGIRLTEYQQGRSIADAARRAGVVHFIFVTLPNVERESNGQFEVRNFTEKALVRDYVRSLAFKYTSFPIPAFQYQNFMAHYAPRLENGQLNFLFPQVSKLAGFDARDMGTVVIGLLKEPDLYNDLEIPLCGSEMPLTDYVTQFNQIAQQNATLSLIPIDSLIRQGGQQLANANLFSWIDNYGWFGNRDLQRGQRLVPLKTWAQFLSETGWRGHILSPEDNLQAPMQAPITTTQTQGQNFKRTIVVFGVGAQGYSVCDALLNSGDEWHIRCIAHDPSSPVCHELSSRGVEIIAAHEELLGIENIFIDRPYAVFASTIPEYAGARISEYKAGRIIADAAFHGGVQHIIFIEEPNIDKESNGKFSFTSFSEKSMVGDYIRKLKFKYCSFPMPAFYYENFQTEAFAPVMENGELTFHFPETSSLSAFSVKDLGFVVLELLRDPLKWNHLQLPLCGEIGTPEEFVRIFNHVTGQKARLNLLPLNVFQGHAANLSSLFGWNSEHTWFGKRDRTLGSKVYPLRDFSTWLKDTRWNGKILHRDFDHQYTIPFTPLGAVNLASVSAQTELKQIVVVFGATGAQGSSVIEALLRSRRYSIRGVCKDLNEPAVNQLRDRGVEMFAVDLTSSLKFGKLFQGVYAVFANVIPDFVNVAVEAIHMTEKRTKRTGSKSYTEYEIAKAIGEAAKQANCSHLIWCSLPDAMRPTNPSALVSKQESIVGKQLFTYDILRQQSFKFISFIEPSFYYQNFQTTLAPIMEGDQLIWTLPDVPRIPAFDVRDIGGVVLGILKNPSLFNNSEISIVGELSTPQQYVQMFDKVTGNKSSLRLLPLESFIRRGGISGMVGEMLKNMLLYEKSDWKLAKSAYPLLKDWQSYLIESKWDGRQMDYSTISSAGNIVAPSMMTTQKQIFSSKNPFNELPLIVVFGGTGKQGGSVIESLMRGERKWRIRAICRNSQSAQGKQLLSRGIEVVEQDFEKPLDPAILQGAYAVFLVTMPIYAGAKVDEFTQGRNVVDAARKVGVRHFIYSSLPNCREVSHGKYNVPHFTEKALVEKYIRDVAEFEYIAFPMPAWFFQNIPNFYPPIEKEGKLVFSFPAVESLTACDIRDMGPIVAAILQNPKKFNGQQIPIASYHGSADNLLKLFSKTSGRQIQVEWVSLKGMQQQGGVAAEFAEMYSYFGDFNYFGTLNWKTGSKIAKLRGFDDFVREFYSPSSKMSQKDLSQTA